MSKIRPIVEGYVKYRDGRKWKKRYCVLCAPASLYSCLHLYLGKSYDDFANYRGGGGDAGGGGGGGGSTSGRSPFSFVRPASNVLTSLASSRLAGSAAGPSLASEICEAAEEASSLALSQALHLAQRVGAPPPIDLVSGFEAGCHLERESNVMLLIGRGTVHAIAHHNVDEMFNWAEILEHLLIDSSYHVTLCQASEGCRLPHGLQASLHVQHWRLCLIGEPSAGCKFICQWRLDDIDAAYTMTPSCTETTTNQRLCHANSGAAVHTPTSRSSDLLREELFFLEANKRTRKFGGNYTFQVDGHRLSELTKAVAQLMSRRYPTLPVMENPITAGAPPSMDWCNATASATCSSYSSPSSQPVLSLRSLGASGGLGSPRSSPPTLPSSLPNEGLHSGAQANQSFLGQLLVGRTNRASFLRHRSVTMCGQLAQCSKEMTAFRHRKITAPCLPLKIREDKTTQDKACKHCPKESNLKNYLKSNETESHIYSEKQQQQQPPDMVFPSVKVMAGLITSLTPEVSSVASRSSLASHISDAPNQYPAISTLPSYPVTNQYWLYHSESTSGRPFDVRPPRPPTNSSKCLGVCLSDVIGQLKDEARSPPRSQELAVLKRSLLATKRLLPIGGLANLCDRCRRQVAGEIHRHCSHLQRRLPGRRSNSTDSVVSSPHPVHPLNNLREELSIRGLLSTDDDLPSLPKCKRPTASLAKAVYTQQSSQLVSEGQSLIRSSISYQQSPAHKHSLSQPPAHSPDHRMRRSCTLNENDWRRMLIRREAELLDRLRFVQGLEPSPASEGDAPSALGPSAFTCLFLLVLTKARHQKLSAPEASASQNAPSPSKRFLFHWQRLCGPECCLRYGPTEVSRPSRWGSLRMLNLEDTFTGGGIMEESCLFRHSPRFLQLLSNYNLLKVMNTSEFSLWRFVPPFLQTVTDDVAVRKPESCSAASLPRSEELKSSSSHDEMDPQPVLAQEVAALCLESSSSSRHHSHENHSLTRWTVLPLALSEPSSPAYRRNARSLGARSFHLLPQLPNAPLSSSAPSLKYCKPGDPASCLCSPGLLYESAVSAQPLLDDLFDALNAYTREAVTASAGHCVRPSGAYHEYTNLQLHCPRPSTLPRQRVSTRESLKNESRERRTGQQLGSTCSPHLRLRASNCTGPDLTSTEALHANSQMQASAYTTLHSSIHSQASSRTPASWVTSVFTENRQAPRDTQGGLSAQDYVNWPMFVSTREAHHHQPVPSPQCLVEEPVSDWLDKRVSPRSQASYRVATFEPWTSTCEAPLSSQSRGLQRRPVESDALWCSLCEPTSGPSDDLCDIPEEIKDPKRNYALVDLRPSPASSVLPPTDLAINQSQHVYRLLQQSSRGEADPRLDVEASSKPDSSASTLFDDSSSTPKSPAHHDACVEASISTVNTAAAAAAAAATAKRAVSHRRHSHSLSSALPEPVLNYVHVTSLPPSELLPADGRFSPTHLEAGGGRRLSWTELSSPSRNTESAASTDPPKKEAKSSQQTGLPVEYTYLDVIRTRALGVLNKEFEGLFASTRDGEHCLTAKASRSFFVRKPTTARSTRMMGRCRKKSEFSSDAH